MTNPLRLAAAAFHGLRLLLKPGHLPSIFGLVDALMSPDDLAAMRAHIRRDPRGAAALDAPFHLAVDLDALAALPPGTLGRAFAEFMTGEGIEPTVLTDQALGATDWVPMHLYEVHDIWHVVLGYGTDVVDEVAILSFMLAQLPADRMAPVAIAVALLRGALGHPTLTPDAVQDAIARGTTAGRRAQGFFGVNWGDRWELPLDQVRAELGVQVGAEAAPAMEATSARAA